MVAVTGQRLRALVAGRGSGRSTQAPGAVAALCEREAGPQAVARWSQPAARTRPRPSVHRDAVRLAGSA